MTRPKRADSKIGTGKGCAEHRADGKVADRAGEPNCLFYGFQKPGCVARAHGRLCPTLNAVPRGAHKTCRSSFLRARTPLQADVQTQLCTYASRAACKSGGARVSQHAHHLSTGLGVGRWPAATGPFSPATVTAPWHDPSRVSREPADRPFTQEEKEVTAKNMRGEKQGANGTWRRARKELTTEKGTGKGGAENCADGKVVDRVGEPFTVYRSRDAAHEHASASFPL